MSRYSKLKFVRLICILNFRKFLIIPFLNAQRAEIPAEISSCFSYSPGILKALSIISCKVYLLITEIAPLSLDATKIS